MTKKARAMQVAKREGRKVALGYIRVSTEEQVASGAGMAAQEAKIRTEAERQGWDLVLMTDAGISAKAGVRRPELERALEILAAGDADFLVVSKLDRLARSVIVGATIIAAANAEGWGLVMIDNQLDTTTTSGKLMANIILSIAEWERDIISERTMEGMAAKKAMGVHVGRPFTLPNSVVDRIIGEREMNATLQGIADGLNEDGVPTARGGARWTSSTVSKVLSGYQADVVRQDRAARLYR